MKYALDHRKCGFCGRLLLGSLAPTGAVFCDSICEQAHERAPDPEELPEALAGWLTRAGDESSRPDPILLEVISGGLNAIAREMAKTMERSAYSPVFHEGVDMTTAIFDASIELVAQCEGVPSQMGSMKFGVTGAVHTLGKEGLQPGDVLLHNDSYVGTPHPPEFCMVKPVFIEDEVVAYVANIAHHTDVGGKSPGSMPGDSTEIFQEGVIIPPVKIIKAGVDNEELWRVYLANVRTPYESYGDAMAMYASLLVGERRVLELLEKYGVDDFARYCRETQRHAERRIRAGIGELPNGTYRGKAVLEDEGLSDKSYLVNIAVVVLDEDIIFDFRGTDAQARGPINSPYAVSLCAGANAIFNLVDPYVSHNEGTFRPLHFILPHGTVVNCDYPAPLATGNTESHNIVVEGVLAALASAVPDRVPAASGSTTMLITGGGRDASNDQFTYIVWEACGWGAFPDDDGATAQMPWVGTGSRLIPAEVLDSRYPWRVVRRELRNDSGGAGCFSGGLGTVTEYEILTDDFEVSSISCRGRFAPAGREGGEPGKVGEIRVVRDGQELAPSDVDPGIVCPTKFSGLRLRRGDRLIVRSPGGGGHGVPTSANGTDRARGDATGRPFVDDAEGIPA